MLMSDLWVDKYRPNNLDEILIPDKSITQIKEWISNFEKNKNKILLLYGPPGVGKTTLSNIILKQYKYDIIEFNTSDVRNQKLIKEKLNDIFNKQNILSIMNKKKTSIGIIMDELDGISSGERSGITEFINLINPKKNKFNNPIICTTNSVSEKKIKEVMKYSLSIKVTKPKGKEIMKLVNKISENENLNITDEQKLELVKKSQFDFRRLVTMMQFIFKNNDSKDEDIDKLIRNYKEKDLDNLLFDSVERILNKYNLDSVLQTYNSDKNIIAMLVYENFLYEIVKNCNEDYNTKVNFISDIYDNFSEADILDNEIMVYHRFCLTNYCGLNKCVITSFIINNMKKYTFRKHTDIIFSKLLNKSSLEYLNYKSLDVILNAFKIHCSTNIHQIFSDFIVFLFQNPKTRIIGEKILDKYKYNLGKLDKIINNSYDKEANKKKINSKK
jgi:DNA polymerase III delta prime subunit